MEDADLELSEELQDLETESEDTGLAPKPFWATPLLGFLFLLLALFLIAYNSGKNRAQNISGPSEALTSYQNLSNETHTGLRLARLDDFLAQFSDSTYANPVRARRNALKRHEEKAWAQLTGAFYDTQADEDIKSAAVKAYTDIWTPLHRPEQLKTLEQILPDDSVPNFKPGEKKSRFASGGNDKFLEGAPIVRVPSRPQTIVRNDRPERINPSRIVEPRIRTRKKPSYPSSARRRRIEADVVLALDIDDKGRVRRTHVVSVSAERYAKDFAKSAQRAARRTRFHPKKIGGRPVPTSGHIQKYAFRNSR